MTQDKIKISRDYDSFVCTVNDTEIDLNKLPERQLKSLAAYGLRKINDTINSDKDVSDKLKAADEMTQDILADKLEWSGKSSAGAEAKLTEAQTALAEFDKMKPAQQDMVAKLGINRAGLEKAVNTARKAVDRKNKKAQEQTQA